MGEVVRNGNLTESESSSVSLFFPISLLIPYPQSNPSDSSRVCCSHRLDLQPNPRAGWAACTLLKNNGFKIFTQETRAVFSNDSKRCFPSPEGHKAAAGAGLGCAAVSSLLPIQVCITPLESSVCAQSSLTGDQWIPSIKGSQIYGEGDQNPVRRANPFVHTVSTGNQYTGYWDWQWMS